jgi:hypothetical protein
LKGRRKFMKRRVVCVAAALIAFLFGVQAAEISRYFQSPASGVSVSMFEAPAMPAPQSFPAAGTESRKLSLRELQVVESAEAFVCQNGYTEQQCGSAGRIYFEPDENPDDVAKIWERRRYTLEGKAYGLTSRGKGRSTVWTVVFRYTERAGKDRERVGRAWVVEDGPFVSSQFISFRHDFPLAKVKKKL